MRKLAGASRQVPKSYLVCAFSRYRVEKTIVASGGFADIRKGRYKGMGELSARLRSRTLVQYTRCGKRSDILSSTVNHTVSGSGLLQGVRGLDEYVPP